jgi:hypothetical protein
MGLQVGTTAEVAKCNPVWWNVCISKVERGDPQQKCNVTDFVVETLCCFPAKVKEYGTVGRSNRRNYYEQEYGMVPYRYGATKSRCSLELATDQRYVEVLAKKI